MLDFLKSLFKPQGSGATAKERLRLVLLSDHLSLAPDTIDALKADLFDVFSRYFEYDAEQAEVTFDHREREVAMLASVPILRVRDRPSSPYNEPVAEPEPAPEPQAEVQPQAGPSPVALLEPESMAVVVAPRSRKRRKKRHGSAANPSGLSPGLSAGHSAQA
jgi:cell division topological specificity factor